MNEEHRQKILHNLVALVEQTNLDALIPVLLQKGVFTLEMGQKYMVSYIQQVFFLCSKPLDFYGTVLVFILTLLQDRTSVAAVSSTFGSLHGEVTRTRYMTSDVFTVRNIKTVVFWLMPLSSLEDG
jgi:hypothetical protein